MSSEARVCAAQRATATATPTKPLRAFAPGIGTVPDAHGGPTAGLRSTPPQFSPTRLHGCSRLLIAIAGNGSVEASPLTRSLSIVMASLGDTVTPLADVPDIPAQTRAAREKRAQSSLHPGRSRGTGSPVARGAVKSPAARQSPRHASPTSKSVSSWRARLWVRAVARTCGKWGDTMQLSLESRRAHTLMAVRRHPTRSSQPRSTLSASARRSCGERPVHPWLQRHRHMSEVVTCVAGALKQGRWNRRHNSSTSAQATGEGGRGGVRV